MIYLIWNTAINQVGTQAPNRARAIELYEAKTFNRGPEQVICEFDESSGINIFNWQNFPQSVMFEGMAKFNNGVTK